MSQSAQSSMATIDAFIQEVGALEKSGAEANTEAGGYQGETEHPVKNVDDSTDDADEGARSAENSEDVKEDQGEPSVDSTPEATSKVGEHGAVSQEGSAADDHLQIGTNVQATGDDPSVETSSTKDTKDDDGHKEHTSHPAATDNEEIDGHKWSADMSLAKLAGVMQDLGNDLCAVLAVEGEGAADPAPVKSASSEVEDPAVSHQAGWELAGLLTGDFDKKAADELVQETLEEIIYTASSDAEKVGHYLDNFYSTQEQLAAESQKKAEGLPGGEDELGGLPQDDLGGAAEEGGGADELAALSAGEGEEGLPPEAAMGGMGMGGPEEGGMGGPEEGGGIADEQQLAAILDELGVSPEELEEALMEEAGGGGGMPPEGGGMPPEGGGMPPEGGGLPEGAGEEALGGMLGGGGGGLPEEEGIEAVASDKRAAAKRGNAQANMRSYITEVIQRSRQR